MVTYTRVENVCPGCPVYGVICLCSRWREWKREGSHSHWHFNILMVWRHFDLNFIIISLLASKCQDFEVEMPVFQPFYEMNVKTSNFKVLALCSQWRYDDQIQFTRSSYHKNQILKCLLEWLPSLPYSHPLEHPGQTFPTRVYLFSFDLLSANISIWPNPPIFILT